MPPLATPSVPAVALDTSNAVTGIVIAADPSKFVAVPVAPPLIAIVRAVVNFAASVTDVTGIVMFALPLNDVAVPTALPDSAIVLAVANVLAVPALPVMSVTVTAPIIPLTDRTFSGVSSFSQLASVVAGVAVRM
jgi:hypothetical protein